MDKEIKPKQKYENGKRVLVYDIPTAEYVERTIIDVRWNGLTWMYGFIDTDLRCGEVYLQNLNQ